MSGNMPRKLMRFLLAPLGALALWSGAALAAATHVTIAVGGAGCLCYLPTVLAQQLGEFGKAGLDGELVNFKGGAQSLTAVSDCEPPLKSIISTSSPALSNSPSCIASTVGR